MYGGKLKNILSMTFHGLFGILWMILLLGITFLYTVSDKQVFIPVFLILAVLVFHNHIIDRIKQIKKHILHFTDKYPVVAITLFIIVIQAAIKIYVGYEMAVNPAGDREIIFKQASKMALNNVFKTNREYNFYFLRYPNNTLILILETVWFMFLKMFGIKNFLYGNIILNIGAIDLAILLCLILVYRKYGKNVAIIFQIMTFLFIPFYTYIPFVYTDTLVLPIVSGILLCYDLLEDYWEQKGVKYYLILCTMGLLTWIGYGLKPTVAIITIACFIHMIVTKNWKYGIISSLVIISIFGICLTTFHSIINHTEVIDQTDYDKENFPYEHWIMMGLKGTGNYNREDRLYTSSFETKKEKEKGDIKIIKERLKNYGIGGLLLHLYEKAIYTWSNGKYDMEYHLQRQPRRNSWLQSFFFKNGNFYPLYNKYCTIYHLIMLLSIILSILYGFVKHETDSAVMWKLALFGLFLFLSIWETKSRYVMHFVPVMLLITIDMLVKIKAIIYRRSIYPSI